MKQNTSNPLSWKNIRANLQEISFSNLQTVDRWNVMIA